MAGRRTKLTPVVRQRIINALKGGVPLTTAVESTGVDYSTFCRWRQRGEAATRGQFYEFCNELRRAQQDAVIRNVTIVQKAAMGGDIVERRTVTKPDGTVAVYEKKSRPEWQAATWWLERKFPNDWAKVDRVQQMPCDEPRFGPNFIIIEDHVGSSIELSRADEAIDVNPDTSQQNLTCGAVSLPLRPAYGKR